MDRTSPFWQQQRGRGSPLRSSKRRASISPTSLVDSLASADEREKEAHHVVAIKQEGGAEKNIIIKQVVTVTTLLKRRLGRQRPRICATLEEERISAPHEQEKCERRWESASNNSPSLQHTQQQPRHATDTNIPSAASRECTNNKDLQEANSSQSCPPEELLQSWEEAKQTSALLKRRLGRQRPRALTSVGQSDEISSSSPSSTLFLPDQFIIWSDSMTVSQLGSLDRFSALNSCAFPAVQPDHLQRNQSPLEQGNDPMEEMLQLRMNKGRTRRETSVSYKTDQANSESCNTFGHLNGISPAASRYLCLGAEVSSGSTGSKSSVPSELTSQPKEVVGSGRHHRRSSAANHELLKVWQQPSGHRKGSRWSFPHKKRTPQFVRKLLESVREGSQESNTSSSYHQELQKEKKKKHRKQQLNSSFCVEQ